MKIIVKSHKRKGRIVRSHARKTKKFVSILDRNTMEYGKDDGVRTPGEDNSAMPKKKRTIRSHMRKALKKKVRKAMEDYDPKGFKKTSHPKTGLIRSSIMDATTKFVKRKGRPMSISGKYVSTHTPAGSKRTHNI